VLSVRSGSLAAYHGPSTSRSTYEQGDTAAKEHERAGRIVGRSSSPASGTFSPPAPRELRPAARLAASFGPIAAATEIFGDDETGPEARPRSRLITSFSTGFRLPSRAPTSSR
jgi:hypothetical protein